ncbi:MAG TPA: hypothetical protein VLJ61_03725 [Pyrinomonadaceae bacterium]|nr:hypothetical protein [Pyrinomonadaceae bacterium]
MRLRLSKSGDVPLREQLVRRIMLGVVSGDLKPGRRPAFTRASIASSPTSRSKSCAASSKSS